MSMNLDGYALAAYALAGAIAGVVVVCYGRVW